MRGINGSGNVNLHGTVRGAITSVRPDTLMIWRQSTGFTQDATYAQVPGYAADQNVRGNVQALTAKDLKHAALQNIEGVVRAVYLFGNVQGVVRPDAKGGDKLVFPQMLGGAAQTWLVVAVLETWGVEQGGWCKVAVSLQQGNNP
jgi:hypothetical protein